MMFACLGTFSLRRFTICAVVVFALLGAAMPYASGIDTLYALRVARRVSPPMLMTVALRCLPPGIKLYGLAAYALTATFAPNLGVPRAALWSDYVGWRWLFWQIAPLTLLSIAMIAWGLPQNPLRLERLRSFDWRGVLLGALVIAMLMIAFTQGTRLGWTDSGLVCALLVGGSALLALFFLNEWFHPLPFFRIQLLARRNLPHALVTLAGVLFVLVAVPSVPVAYLAEVHQYRPLQLAPSLSVALLLVAALCNLRGVDCRWVLAGGHDDRSGFRASLAPASRPNGCAQTSMRCNCCRFSGSRWPSFRFSCWPRTA